MDVIVYNDPGGNVVAYTPPGGMTAEEAQATCPQPSWIVDSATLPAASIVTWVLTNGVVTVDQAKAAALAIPQSVTNTQLKRQLDAMGKLSAAQTAVSQAGGLTMELWYGAGTFNRTDPLLTAMASVIGMSSADVDAAFIAAAKL